MPDIEFSTDERAVIESLTIIYTAHAHLKAPSPKGYQIFIRMLKSIPPDILRRACENIAMKTETPWNVPANIQREANRLMGVVDADEAYALIEEMMTNFYAPELGQTSMIVMEMKLKQRNQGFLFPMLKRWGPEIWLGGNTTAVRAQFRDAYEKETERRSSPLNLAAGQAMKMLKEKIEQPLLESGPEASAIVDVDWTTLRNALKGIVK